MPSPVLDEKRAFVTVGEWATFYGVPQEPLMNVLLERTLGPGVELMQRLRLPGKFAWISAAFLLPLCVSLYGLVSYSADNIDFANDERSGTQWIAPLNALASGLIRQNRTEVQDSLLRIRALN